MKHSSALSPLLALLPVLTLPITTLSFAYSDTDIIERWKPIVMFAGNGQPQIAIDKLRGINEIQTLMVDHSTFDPQSQRFIDELWGSIEDFNLARFYSILPEQNGDWRELHVQGRRQGSEYCYVDASKKDIHLMERVNALGDSSLLVQSRQIYKRDTKKMHYLMGADWHIGWGSYSWQTFRSTVNESIKLLSKPEFSQTPDSEKIRTIKTSVRNMNNTLGEEDLTVIAPLWAAFPHLWAHFAQIGSVENVLVDKSTSHFGLDPEKDTLKDVEIIISIDPEKMADQYPEIAAYIDRVDDLLRVSLTLFNSEGQLMEVTLDTTHLQVKLAMLVNGDGLVPVENGVVKPEKTQYFADQDIHMMAVVNATIDMLGVTTEVSNIRSRLNYHPFGKGASINLNMNTLPEVKVKGMALGVIPTQLIDAFLPTNIDEIILEFMQVAVQGNDGKGIEAAIGLQNTQTAGVTHMAVTANVEALDSLLARMAVAIVNQRLIPSEKQGKELVALVKSSRQAFDLDLAQYEKIVGSHHLAAHSP